MTVLGDCNNMFDTLVRITAALKAQLLGIEEDPITVDCSIPAVITLNCIVETLADKQSLLCTSEEPTCSCDSHNSGSCDMATFCCSIETLIKTRSTSHGGGMHGPSLYPASDATDVFEAPHVTAGDVGFNSKDFAIRTSVSLLGLESSSMADIHYDVRYGPALHLRRRSDNRCRPYFDVDLCCLP